MNRTMSYILLLMGFTLLILPIANLAAVSVQLEMRLAMRYIYVSAVSWGIVWITGCYVTAIAIEFIISNRKH